MSSYIERKPIIITRYTSMQCNEMKVMSTYYYKYLQWREYSIKTDTYNLQQFFMCKYFSQHDQRFIYIITVSVCLQVFYK